MSKLYVGPKGMACRCDLLPEYAQGREAFHLHREDPSGGHNENPYPYFGTEEQYVQHYAFCIGIQHEEHRHQLSHGLLWPVSI